GGTNCLTGGKNITVTDRPALDLRLDFGRADALDAVSAFLHDAAAADGHLRVTPQLEAFGGIVGVREEVEAPHLVGAVVRAVARADAAVIDHVVEAVGAVDRRAHRADQLTRGVLALHAGHRLEEGLRVLQITSVIAV